MAKRHSDKRKTALWPRIGRKGKAQEWKNASFPEKEAAREIRREVPSPRGGIPLREKKKRSYWEGEKRQRKLVSNTGGKAA